MSYAPIQARRQASLAQKTTCRILTSGPLLSASGGLSLSARMIMKPSYTLHIYTKFGQECLFNLPSK